MSECYYINSELYHYGIKDMKWGIRRFQNPDGSLTEEGKKRYAKDMSKYGKINKKINKLEKKTTSQMVKLARSKNPNFDKYRKTSRKFQNSLNRGNRFVKRMERRYSSSLSNEVVSSGKRWTDLALANASYTLSSLKS